jgi:hypothetical protein
MFGSELRTYGLSAVVSVLLGAGIGFGGHYFMDGAGGRAVAAAATPSAPQDAPNPPSSNPFAPREGPVLDVAGFQIHLTPHSPDEAPILNPLTAVRG